MAWGLVILTCSVMVRRPRLERRDWDRREDGRTRKRETVKPVKPVKPNKREEQGEHFRTKEERFGPKQAG